MFIIFYKTEKLLRINNHHLIGYIHVMNMSSKMMVISA